MGENLHALTVFFFHLIRLIFKVLMRRNGEEVETRNVAANF